MDYPQLEVLMGAYFHEDFDMYDGTLWGALNQFLKDSSVVENNVLLDDIERALTAMTHDAELDAYLEKLGSNVYRGDEPGGYRGWLEEIARRVRSAQTS